MQLEELKSRIENKWEITYPLVFLSADMFLPMQYVKRLVLEPEFVDEYVKASGFFATSTNNIKVLRTSELNVEVSGNYIVICKKVEPSITPLLNIIEFPKLEDWMIEDYAYSNLEGVKETNIAWLVNVCKHDIYRLEQEIDRIKLFDNAERNIVFEQFRDDGIFNDLSELNIFTMSNALQNKDIQKVESVYESLQTASSIVDIEPLGLYTILYNNFKKMIKVWMNSNPTEETTGMPNNQIWAIKNLKKMYTKEQLLKVFMSLLKIDEGFKSGKFPIEIIVDYLVITCLVS